MFWTGVLLGFLAIGALIWIGAAIINRTASRGRDVDLRDGPLLPGPEDDPPP